MTGLFRKGPEDEKKKLIREKKKKLKKLAKDKKYDQVLKIGEEILKKEPDDIDILFIVGGVEYKYGRLKKAMHYFDRVLAISNYDVDTLILKANVLFQQSQYEEANLCCNKIKEIDPKNKKVLELLQNISDAKQDGLK